MLPPPLIKTLVKYLYLKKEIPRNSCKQLQLTHLINWTVKLWRQVRIGDLDHWIQEWLEIDDYSCLNERIRIYSNKKYKVKIWKFCSIANGVSFIAFIDHNLNCLTTSVIPEIRPKKYTSPWATIEVWNDVRIWKNAIILKWVKIWTWAVVWAGAVVTKDVPPYAVVVWAPAKIIKYRFDKEIIGKLLNSKWRNRDIKKIGDNYNLEFIRN